MGISLSAYDAGGGVATVSWSTSVRSGYNRFAVSIALADGSTSYYNGSSLSGSINAYIGYNTAQTFFGIVYYHNNAGGADTNDAAYASVTTGSPPPTYPPASPTITATANSTTGVVTASWTDVGASYYQLYRDGAAVGGAVSGTSTTDSPTRANHSYYVQAVNSGPGGVASSLSNTVAVSFNTIRVRVSGSWVYEPTNDLIVVRNSANTGWVTG